MKSPDRRGRGGDRKIRRDRGQAARRSSQPGARPRGQPSGRGPGAGPPAGGGPAPPRTAGRLHAGRESSQQATAQEHAMSLSHHEHSPLRRIEASLCRPDRSWPKCRRDRARQAAALQVLRRLTRQASVPAGRPRGREHDVRMPGGPHPATARHLTQMVSLPQGRPVRFSGYPSAITTLRARHCRSPRPTWRPSRSVPVHSGVAVCNGSEVPLWWPGQFPAGRAGARPVIFSLSSHNSRATVSSRAAADGSRRWRLT